MNRSDSKIDELVRARYPSDTDVRKRFEYSKELMLLKQYAQVEIIDAVENNWPRVQKHLKAY